MELLYLLGSVVASTITTTFLSISLFFRTITSSCFSTATDVGNDDGNGGLWLYEGQVRHVRRRPVHHEFVYPVRYALVDLDNFESTSSVSPLQHHMSAPEARRAAGTDGKVLLLTIPMSVGYEQNPLSVYYCFGGSDGSAPCLEKCVAEVTNTPWGESVTFVFSPGSDVAAKPLHVSPFMDMLGSWRMHAEAPGNKLFLVISVQHPTFGNYFTASLTAKRVPSSLPSVRLETFFWLMPQKVAIWIYWQALKLWWKSVSFKQHPKYTTPTYRQDALVRDRELRSSLINGSMGNEEERYCVWRDAQWPWA